MSFTVVLEETAPDLDSMKVLSSNQYLMTTGRDIYTTSLKAFKKEVDAAPKLNEKKAHTKNSQPKKMFDPPKMSTKKDFDQTFFWPKTCSTNNSDRRKSSDWKKESVHNI